MLALKILNFPNRFRAEPSWHYKVLLISRMSLERLIAAAEDAGDNAKAERLNRRLRATTRIIEKWGDYRDQKKS